MGVGCCRSWAFCIPTLFQVHKALPPRQPWVTELPFCLTGKGSTSVSGRQVQTTEETAWAPSASLKPAAKELN